jgi:hypothetical protein
MKKVFCRSLVLALGVVLVASAASAKNVSKGYASYDREASSIVSSDNPVVLNGRGPAASAQAGTTWLYGPHTSGSSFDAGASCSVQGWTTLDLTAQDLFPASYWHVDDFTNNPLPGYAAIQGDKSLWCGARPNGASTILCGYLFLPGYGNGWNQAICTINCLTITDGADGDTDEDIGVAFKAFFDSEPGYDATSLEYEDCSNPGWVVLDGGTGTWDGLLTTDVIADYNVPGVTSAKVRLHFQADGAWSDQDGYWPTDGAVIIDSLTVEGLGPEDFEGEAHNAQAFTGWNRCTPLGYDALVGHAGFYLSLVPGLAQAEEDPCGNDFSCVWAAINNSTYFYTCGTPAWPAQKAVPYGGLAAVGEFQYMNDETWSPNIPIVGSGSRVVLEFTSYRDQPLDNLIFYVWHVRDIIAGCPGAWKDLNFVYYGGQKDWIRIGNDVGSLLTLSGAASHMQVAIGVVDMCFTWCGTGPGNYGSGDCHGSAPYIDRVQVYRINTVGPQWLVRDIDTFQDSFANDGTLTGTVRADMANDITTGANPAIVPGDSSTVIVSDPISGIANHQGGGKAIYCYVAVWPLGQPGKSGTDLSGGTRWPWVGSQVISGVTWDCYRFDQSILNGNPVANNFCIDLNDNVFEPCDTVCFFYCAESADGDTLYGNGYKNYYSLNWGTDANINNVAANAMEFTCLPAGGWKRGGDILYVDGMDGRGAQVFWDTAFQSLGLIDKIDRFDVRGPSSGVNNRPDGRVFATSQLTNCYRKILWDTGDLSITLGDGSGTPEKTDDYQLVNDFLANLQNPGGVYLCGNDMSEQLNGYSGLSATNFRSSYLSYTHIKANHHAAVPAPDYGISPAGIHNPAGCFDDDIVIYGGCPLIDDFDVLQATAPTATSEMTYGASDGSNDAVISQVTNNGTTNVGVVFSGFAFEYIRDDADTDGIMDRAKHLYDIIVWLGNTPQQPTGTGPALKNELSQNYPNPFNPQTTIAFSIKDRGAVSVKVYNVAGQLVRTLANENRAAGTYTLVWDGRNDGGSQVASGVYFYKLVTNNFSQTKKMVLLK